MSLEHQPRSLKGYFKSHESGRELTLIWAIYRALCSKIAILIETHRTSMPEHATGIFNTMDKQDVSIGLASSVKLRGPTRSSNRNRAVRAHYVWRQAKMRCLYRAHHIPEIEASGVELLPAMVHVLVHSFYETLVFSYKRGKL